MLRAPRGLEHEDASVPSTYWSMRLYPAAIDVLYSFQVPVDSPDSFTQTSPLPEAL